MPNLPYKLLCALGTLPRALRPVPRPRLIMTLLVKDEADLLEQNLLFHKAMGVEAFIVTDNNSTDRTPDIIRRYRACGWIIESLVEPGTNYDQKRWVDRMVWLARTRHGADWIINADADEFWYTPGGSLPAALAGLRATVADCPVVNVYPEEGQPWTTWGATVRAVPDPAAYNLSPYSLFGRATKKVAHRADGYLQISMGNHKVSMLPARHAAAPITVYHYNIRSREAFMQKMINGGRQLLARKSRHGGRHWRYFYALHEQGLLSAEYDRVVGTAERAELTAAGYIRPDNPLPALLAGLSAPASVSRL